MEDDRIPVDDVEIVVASVVRTVVKTFGKLSLVREDWGFVGDGFNSVESIADCEIVIGDVNSSFPVQDVVNIGLVIVARSRSD